MPIEYAKSSIFNTDCQTIVNPVNTAGSMGAGLAAEFKRRFPGMFSEYVRHCVAGRLKVGTLWLCKSTAPWVLCLPTKQHWKTPSTLEIIEGGLINLANTYEQRGITSVALPHLGCGLGGLEWADVKPLIEGMLGSLLLRVVICGTEKSPAPTTGAELDAREL